MAGLGRGSEGLFGRPRGRPEKPLLEAFIVFIAFYLASYASAPSPGGGAREIGYHLSILGINLPRALFILYLMAVSDGLPLFELSRFSRRDAARGLLCALGAFAVILGPGLLFSAFGIQNPLFAQARSQPKASLWLIPFMLGSSMATGYCEELFFRSYLIRRLEQGGLPPLWAGIASSLLFGSGHSYQGVVGLVSGSLLGLFFAWRWIKAGNIHEIAIGHGLFDSAAFAILVYS
jgi:uncharacterized protein